MKIADFGLSRLIGSESNELALTGTHQVMGTLRYMAPEQLDGAHHVDHRADIYSLGVVFYEMLTGELPLGRFSVPSHKVQIDVRLDDVVLRTLEREPQRRYQRASQVKSDLESIASGHGHQLNPTVDLDSTPVRGRDASTSTSLENQALAGRMLLVRRELMGRVERALRPLFWGQILQMLIGILFIAIGVHCWTRNMEVPHRLGSGILLHVYGVALILCAGVTCARIRRLDYSKPLDEVRAQLQAIQSHYLRSGTILGFSWWLLWIPLSIAIGFDFIAEPRTLLITSLLCLFGLIASLTAFWKVLGSEHPMSEIWTRALAGESLTAASVALEEIASAEIR